MSLIYRISFLILIVLPSFFSSPVYGQTLYQMLERVVVEHNLIQAAESGRQAAAQDVRQARADWLPHLYGTASVGQEYIDPPGPRSSTSETRNYQSLRASQLIFDFGRTGSGINRAKAGFGRSEVELAATRQDIILQGITAYLDVYRNAKRLEFARQSEQRIIDLTGIEETLVTRGAGLASDVLQAKSQLAGAMAQRARAEGQLSIARSRFNTVFGFSISDEDIRQMTRPSSPLEYLPASVMQAVKSAEESSLDLHIAQYNIEMAEHDIKIRQAGYLPRLNLVGELKRKENDSGVRGTRNEALGMVEITWALFSGGKDRAATAQARHILEEQQKIREDLSTQIEERVLTAWQNLITSRENARFLKDQADILEEFLELAKRERLLGTRSLLDVLNGEVTHLNALSNAIYADVDQDLAVYGMLYAMGILELDVLSQY
ncbi:TolC family outer membrane protein [Desulfonatronovibrio magnus]|uniref:TolC family outer membrane protein n=1 Tax=Desulfonatronovibrio magnus TaxID=698827 RepID=UPI0005EADA58|nr:TolC family outer membrane protein [Desulfonatronovibrio magnus]